MRTDIKVGIAIAVILIGIGVVWVVFFRHDSSAEKAPGTGDAEVSGRTEDTNVVVTTPPTTDQPPVLTQTDTLIRPPYRDRESVVTPRPADDTTTPAVATTAYPSGMSGEWGDVPDRPGRTASGRETTESTASAVRPAVGTEQTYVVKDGDTYWTIAQNLWGDGLLHTHLQKANPRILPSDLRPRMTINVPPKPVVASSALVSASVAAASSGTTGVDSLTGKRYYIVKKDDMGFSAISKTVYGDEKYWKLIESANPGLDSRKLRPGQKVLCPDKPVLPAGAAVTPAGTESAHVGSTMPAPSAVGSGGAGAPTRTKLPDGRIFD